MINRITILGIEYRIENLEGENLGEADVDNRTLYINYGQHTFQEAIDSTLLHECMHAIIGMAGTNEEIEAYQEEAIVRSLETGLIPVIKQLIAAGRFK